MAGAIRSTSSIERLEEEGTGAGGVAVDELIVWELGFGVDSGGDGWRQWGSRKYLDRGAVSAGGNRDNGLGSTRVLVDDVTEGEQGKGWGSRSSRGTCPGQRVS